MSCPDWRALVAARDADPGGDLPAWSEARRHLADCGRCRRLALAADPLLVFARLPERTVTPGEIASMQSAVASLVRASRVGQASGSGEGGVPGRTEVGGSPGATRALRRSLTRFAALLGACTLLALSGAPLRHAPGLGGLVASGGLVLVQGVAGEGALPVQSVVEELDRPGARIYELPQADMAVVMIVDASLDV